MYGFTLRSNGQFDVSIEGPPFDGLIWYSTPCLLEVFSVFLPLFLVTLWVDSSLDDILDYFTPLIIKY